MKMDTGPFPCHTRSYQVGHSTILLWIRSYPSFKIILFLWLVKPALTEVLTQATDFKKGFKKNIHLPP